MRAAADELSFASSGPLRAGHRQARPGRGAGQRVAGTWFNGSLLDSVYQTLHVAGQELLIYRTLDAAERDEFFATLPARRNADALIVASLELAAGSARPACVTRDAAGLRQPAGPRRGLRVDRRRGRRGGATRHLINLGHRRIAFVGLGHAAGTHQLARIGWPVTAR